MACSASSCRCACGCAAHQGPTGRRDRRDRQHHRAFRRADPQRLLYGDYQFATDDTRDSFLRRGVFSCYEPVDPVTPLTPNPTRFNPEDWARLTFYSHTHKRLAFNAYSSRYTEDLRADLLGRLSASAAYVDNYHDALDQATGAELKATEMITEIYVERPRLAAFMEDAREVLRGREANVIYGTVRLIEQDDETFLAWARTATRASFSTCTSSTRRKALHRRPTRFARSSISASSTAAATT